MKKVFFDDYADGFPMVVRAAPVETMTQVIRLVLSGVFAEHPGLKFMLGRLGEAIPFMMWRIDQTLSRPGQQPVDFRDTFAKHFWVSTSGLLSTPALNCAVAELSIDRILFSIDYPFVDNRVGTEWIRDVDLAAEDKRKILSENAVRLFRLDG